ncbi:MAG: zinc-finger domain-containing protein [Kiloniellales bacterium]|nr:zinc-finger domain-containing protein [Kiloniellales bacterium]MDJ0972086.1 zinc-finger domain-containing protein [Kiloniellales bacterium]MDJ0982690.1 zinc-finger domain-containing protein [Kiloniellales bacterium]
MDAPLDPPEVVEVDSEIVACEGDGGALGHPRVFLNMEGKGQIDCPYCDRRFVLKAGAKAAGGH